MSRMHNPAHPGEVLREFIPVGITVTEAAQRLGVSRVMLSRVLNGRSSMTADMAIRVGLLTRTTPESWLSNQMQWDLWQSSLKRKPNVLPLRRAAGGNGRQIDLGATLALPRPPKTKAHPKTGP